MLRDRVGIPAKLVRSARILQYEPLPAVPLLLPARPGQPSRRNRRKRGEREEGMLMKTVLVVDDNKCIRDLLQMVLGALPECAVRTAGDGAEAITVLSSEPVDVVLTDLSMPVIDGYRLIGHIRKDHANLPVLAMSSDPRPYAESRLSGSTVGRYFEKPFDVYEVAREIASVLERSKDRTMPAAPVRAAFFDHREHAVPV